MNLKLKWDILIYFSQKKIIKQTQISEEIGEFNKTNNKFNKHILKPAPSN